MANRIAQEVGYRPAEQFRFSHGAKILVHMKINLGVTQSLAGHYLADYCQEIHWLQFKRLLLQSALEKDKSSFTRLDICWTSSRMSSM